jgi:hypothetical protein
MKEERLKKIDKLMYKYKYIYIYIYIYMHIYNMLLIIMRVLKQARREIRPHSEFEIIDDSF